MTLMPWRGSIAAGVAGTGVKVKRVHVDESEERDFSVELRYLAAIVMRVSLTTNACRIGLRGMQLTMFDDDKRQVWLRAFYGFDPEGAGYIGFTNEGDRRAMLGQFRDGDLVLIYGAVESQTQSDLRSQALGFLEVSLDPCSDRERMSDEAYEWKVQHGFRDRWTHGLQIRRAWRVTNRVKINTIAPEACKGYHRFSRTTRAMVLTAQERTRALSHPVYQVNVFGEPPLEATELQHGAMGKILKPSSGIPPNFGTRTSEYLDGENTLYLMMLSAPARILMGNSIPSPTDVLVKVGRSNNPVRRLNEINAGFPKPSVVQWKLVQTQTFQDGEIAHNHECELKDDFARFFTSQDGEFFTGDEKKIKEKFSKFCVDRLPKILGSAKKAYGV
ncbi:MAG: GIY-YIG nuclease family protein [Polymorphobacter sp.]